MKLEDELKLETPLGDDFLRAILSVLLTADQISSKTNGALKPFGISKEQYNVLRILRGQHLRPITLQNIAGRMISKSSNATRLVEKLRSKGLVERATCDADRRKVDVRITSAGLTLLKRADPAVRASSEKMRRLTQVEARELSRLLEKIRS